MRRNDQGARGRLVFSVMLELALDRFTAERQQQMEQVTRDLLLLFERSDLKATWAVADPTHSAATAAIAASRLPHEVAVLGERSWLGPGSGRMRIERELARRVGGAQQSGIAVSTLVLRDVTSPLDSGLLRELQIRTVASPAAGFSSAGEFRPGLRNGVWHAPQAWPLPVAPRWWRPIRWQAARRLRQASRLHRTLHVAIDGDALVDQGRPGMAQVAAVLKEAAQYRQREQLVVQTLAEYAAENVVHHVPRSATSLLAPAA